MSTPAPTARAVLTHRRFWRHFLEMLIAMVVGVVALGPLWPDLQGGSELHVLVMATNMTIGMAVWMAVRRHGGWLPAMILAMLRRPAEYTC
jgi:flagellar biosynthetic protein FliP